jgi:hypothetical protein
MEQLVNLIMKSFADSLAWMAAEKNLKYDKTQVIAIFKQEIKSSIATITKDTKEANEAFLGNKAMTEKVLMTGIQFEGLRIAKKVLKLN